MVKVCRVRRVWSRERVVELDILFLVGLDLKLVLLLVFEATIRVTIEELVPAVPAQAPIFLATQVLVAPIIALFRITRSLLAFIIALIQFRITLHQLAHLSIQLISEGIHLLFHVFLKLNHLVLLLRELEVVVVWHRQPRVVQHLLGCGTPIVVPFKHGQEEVTEGLCFFVLNHVLISEHFLDRPESEVLDPSQMTATIEVLLRVLA